jgi:TPR repeat protein
MAVTPASSRKTFAQTLKLAHIGDREAQYQLGLMYANGVGTAQNLDKAIEWVSKAAQRGLAAAQYLLATRYANGIAVSQDPSAALWWYLSAAQQGHLKAHYKVGQWLAQAHPQASLAALRIAAEQGLAEAQHALALALGAAPEGSADGAAQARQAFDWLQRAATQGLASAQCALGQAYAEGLGVQQDRAQAFVWYRKAARQNYPKAQLALEYLSPMGGRKSQGRKKASAAERRQETDRWVRVADGGDAEAKYCVGLMYELALGVDHDPHVARAMYLGAARLGHAKAQAALARLLEASEPQLAHSWYSKAAQAGEADAQHGLARMLARAGDGQQPGRTLSLQLQAALAGHAGAQLAVALKLDSDTAALRASLLQQAADRGEVEAQYRLGCCLAKGMGLAQNRAQAAHWWEKAARAGHVAAASDLGGVLLAGEGVAPDPVAALPWLQQAADAGDATAQWNLGGMYVSAAGGLAQDREQALAWCHKAADQGFAPALATLGVLYAHLGQSDKALHYLQQAAQAGDPEAQYNLALMYRSGKGTARNLERAFEWLCQAAEQGVASAQSKLGVAYGAGEGVAADPIEAHKWLLIASRRGDAVAAANLEYSRNQLDLLQIKEATRRAGLWSMK